MSNAFLYRTVALYLLLCAYATAAPEPLETILVTASRTPVPRNEIGSSVSIITREELTGSHATYLTDLLRELPGFAVSRQGPAGALTQLRVRGAEANQVLVMIDGIEANDVAQGSEFNFAHILTDQIQRVEIVRGPQSALWGSDALAGVINIITRPETGADADSRFSGSVKAGSFDTREAALAWQYGSNDTAITISATRFDTAGTNISRTGNEDDGYENTTLSLAGRTNVADNFMLSWTLRDVDSRSDYDDVDFMNTGLPIDAPFVTRSNQSYGGATIEFDLLDGEIDQIISLARTESDNVNHSASPVADETHATKDQISWQTNWLIPGRDQVLSLVTEYERVDYEQRGAISFFGDPNRNLTAHTRSLALEYRIKTGPLAVSTSYRHDDNSEFEDANTWRLTGSLELPNDDTRIHASVGEAVKNPTFTERFGFFDTFIGNPTLKPEASFSWEAGIHHDFLSDRMSLAATWFRARLKDEINSFVFDANAGGFTAQNRELDSDREGVELTWSWLATDRLAIDAAWTWLDSTEDLGHTVTDEIRRPRHTGSLQADYAWQDANLRLSVVYTGRQYDNYFPPFPPFQQRVALDSFTLVNLSAGYKVNDQIRLFTRLENLLDQDYEEVYGFQTSGLGAYAGVKVEW